MLKALSESFRTISNKSDAKKRPVQWFPPREVTERPVLQAVDQRLVLKRRNMRLQARRPNERKWKIISTTANAKSAEPSTACSKTRRQQPDRNTPFTTRRSTSLSRLQERDLQERSPNATTDTPPLCALHKRGQCRGGECPFHLRGVRAPSPKRLSQGDNIGELERDRLTEAGGNSLQESKMDEESPDVRSRERACPCLQRVWCRSSRSCLLSCKCGTFSF